MLLAGLVIQGRPGGDNGAQPLDVERFRAARPVRRPAARVLGGEDLLRSRGVEVTVLDDAECIALMEDFIAREPALWNEDIGEES